jgi:hypothetical protein
MANPEIPQPDWAIGILGKETGYEIKTGNTLQKLNLSQNCCGGSRPGKTKRENGRVQGCTS